MKKWICNRQYRKNKKINTHFRKILVLRLKTQCLMPFFKLSKVIEEILLTVEPPLNSKILFISPQTTFHLWKKALSKLKARAIMWTCLWLKCWISKIYIHQRIWMVKLLLGVLKKKLLWVLVKEKQQIISKSISLKKNKISNKF